MDQKFADYLMNPVQIQVALDLLEEKSEELDFWDLRQLFETSLGIKPYDEFPIIRIHLSGMICRARINDYTFVEADSIDQIGINNKNIVQGRANTADIPIFYGSNSKKTAAFEVLQDSPPGDYYITIGCWKSDSELHLVNFVDGADTDFSNIPFVHSLPKEYLKDWPEAPRKSAALLINFFNSKFKSPKQPGLFNVTNVIAAFCYSLLELDGLGYAAISTNYDGFNIAVRDPSKLKCVEVERWLFRKYEEYRFDAKCLKKGNIHTDGTIKW